MKNFKSKTALYEHILQLRNDGYLIEKELTEPLENGKTRIQKVYAINFGSVSPKESKV